MYVCAIYLVEGQICNKTFFERIDLNIEIPSKGERMLENQNRIVENLTKLNDIYELKVGDMCVVMAYNENQKSFNECMLNILKQKVKIG